MEPALEYANTTGRPTAAFVEALGRVVPGVRLVQDQVAPYAQAWHRANLVAVTRPGPRWVVLGDSMSQGIGASSFDAGWVNQVQERLAREGRHYQVVNLAASGARVADVLAQQLPAWRSLPGDTDLVTVLIGSNDLVRRQHRDSLALNFAELLAALPPGAVVANLPNPRQAAVTVNRLIDQARTERGIIVADTTVRRRESWKGRLAEDHFHPNELGYAGIADTFYRAISRSHADRTA